MAMISLVKGGTFFGHIVDYNWKGKFLVVELYEIVGIGGKENRIVSWDNVESVYVSEGEGQGEEKKAEEDIKKAIEDVLYRNITDPIITGLALLPVLLDAFPLRLFKLCPELDEAYKKLKSGEVKL